MATPISGSHPDRMFPSSIVNSHERQEGNVPLAKAKLLDNPSQHEDIVHTWDTLLIIFFSQSRKTQIWS